MACPGLTKTSIAEVLYPMLREYNGTQGRNIIKVRIPGDMLEIVPFNDKGSAPLRS